MRDAHKAINHGAPLSAGEMAEDERLALAWTVAGAVADPEIPVLTIADLGVLRNVLSREGGIEI